MMHGRLVKVLGAATIVAIAAACVPVTPPPPPPPPPAGTPTLTFDKTFITGLAQPWDIAFTPDTGTLLYTEKGGSLSSFVAGTKKLVGTVTSTVVLGEGGLMGLAVDPGFATNHFVYVCTTTSSDNRIVRLTVDLGAAPGAGITAQVDTALTGMTRSSIHNGCRTRFKPGTNALFITMGDAAIGTTPQDPSSLNGEVLRATVTNGVFSPAGVSGGYVYTSGHRNPQGIGFRPGTNEPYTAEHGPNIDDEVNRLGSAPGGNSGWDPVPGYTQSVPMTDFAKFPGAMPPVWESANDRTIAPSGLAFLDGAEWKDWDGWIVLAVLKDSELRLLSLNPDGSLAGELQIPGSTGTRLRSVVEGPDDKLYVATDVASPNGAIWQITPS